MLEWQEVEGHKKEDITAPHLYILILYRNMWKRLYTFQEYSQSYIMYENVANAQFIFYAHSFILGILEYASFYDF